MTKPRVLIVGATGRTGGTIVDALLKAGETVRSNTHYPVPVYTALTLSPGSRSPNPSRIKQQAICIEAQRPWCQDSRRRDQRRRAARWYLGRHRHHHQRRSTRSAAPSDPTRRCGKGSRRQTVCALRLHHCLPSRRRHVDTG